MSAKKNVRSTTPTTLYLNPDDLAALRRLRDRTGVPVAVMLRRAVKATLADTERKLLALDPLS